MRIDIRVFRIDDRVFRIAIGFLEFAIGCLEFSVAIEGLGFTMKGFRIENLCEGYYQLPEQNVKRHITVLFEEL